MCTEKKKRHVKQDTLNFFILVVGPLRGGGGGVVKKLFFYDLPEPHETQEKKKNCMLCSVLINIDQQKKVFCQVSKNIIFSNLNLKNFLIDFLSILDHFQVIMVRPLRNLFFMCVCQCLPLPVQI